jgi:hypothetical protein
MLYQSIIVKILPATNTKGTRFKAYSSFGKDSVTLPRDYSKNEWDNVKEAAESLCRKLKWSGIYAGASLTEDSWVFVESWSNDGFSIDSTNFDG